MNKDSTPRLGDRSTCDNCEQPVVYRHPESHVTGFWTHDDGFNREGRESHESMCNLRAKPSTNGDYEALRDSLAEGLWLGGISEKPQATSDARHIIGWLQAEGYVISKAGEKCSSGVQDG